MRLSAGVWQGAAEHRITVVPINDPPIVTDGSFSLVEDTTLEGSISGFDPEGETVTFELLCPPRLGVVEIGTGTGSSAPFVYRPHPEAAGTDSFVFLASDGEATSAGQVRRAEGRACIEREEWSSCHVQCSFHSPLCFRSA